MKVVILAGGLGTRLSEETETKPKPMIEIGQHPMLWHIMKIYAHFCFTDFYIAMGYKGEAIKRYFWDLQNLSGSLSFELSNGRVRRYDANHDQWHVHLIETGTDTQTGGRVKRLQPYLNDEPFLLTYGDGVSNVDLHALLKLHQEAGRVGTVTAVHPPARFGGLTLEDDLATGFSEKSQIEVGWINGGFFVFEPQIFDYIEGDSTNLEADVLPKLAAENQLTAYRHADFWQCMDTLREKRFLDSLWNEGDQPWKIWKD